MPHQVEVELRYHLPNREEFVNQLEELGATHERSEHIIDHWFLPNDIKDDAAQRKWFDVDRGWGLRIREIEQEDGSFKASLGSKRVVNDDGHRALAEAEFDIEGYEQALPLIDLMDRREFLTIDKQREAYSYEDYEILIDDIKGCGVGVEIEVITDKDRAETLTRIRELARSLGLPDSDEHDISITVSAMKDLARY